MLQVWGHAGDCDLNKTDGRYAEYVEAITSNLSSDGFEIKRNIQVSGYTVDVLGYKWQSSIIAGYHAVCAVMFVETVTPDFVKDYSNKVFRYGSGLGRLTPLAHLVFPVLASTKFRDDSKSFVADYYPRHFDLGRWSMEHPVLVELESKRIFHREIKSFGGYWLQRKTNNIAKNYFAPESLRTQRQ